MITPSQADIILRTFPWPRTVLPPTRADIDCGDTEGWMCILFRRGNPQGLGASGAHSAEGAMRFAFERWLTLAGVPREEAHRLSLRLTN